MSADVKGLLDELGPLPRVEDVLPRQSRAAIITAAEEALRLLDEGQPTAARSILWRVIAVERLGADGAARLEAERVEARVPAPGAPTLVFFVENMPEHSRIDNIRLDVTGHVVEIDVKNLLRRVESVFHDVVRHEIDLGSVEHDRRSGRNLKRALAAGGEAAVRKALGL